jgi:tetratricopeptide (TPR) repeat protein
VESKKMLCLRFNRLDPWFSFLFPVRDLRVGHLICSLVVAAALFPFTLPSQAQDPISNANIQPETSKEDNPLIAASPAEHQDALLERVKSLLDQGSLDKAEYALRQYLDKHPASSKGHFLRGYVLFKQAKAGESLAEYTEGAKYHDPSAFDLKVVALNYVLLGNYADADRWLTRSLEWNPKDSEGWYYLGRTKYNENRYEEAIRAFEQCLELDPRNVKAEDNLGLSYEGLGRTEEAFAAYRKAIAWQMRMLNKNPGPFINLGSLLLNHNRIEDAISYLSQAVETRPQDSRAHEQLGKAYSRLNKLQNAQVELEKAIALAPDNASLHFMLGQVYRKQGMTEKAKLELARGAALNDTRSQVLLPRPLD